MKKLLLLGASRYALPVIKSAHEMGDYVITCDYLPDNIAHQYSDQYCNVSVIDKDAVLKAAENLQIDGIMSFACDPGVVTAAYVAEKMGLPSCGSYQSVSILQNKGKFRRFLEKNGFNVPVAKQYTKYKDAIEDIELFHWPVIVKPTDSAGSKGVRKVDKICDLKKSVEYALTYSHSGEFIIEDFLLQSGFSSDTDSFSVDGELKFVSFNCQRFDSNAGNPYTPAAYSWPSSISDLHQKELQVALQRLLTLLKMGTSLYNIETRECVDGKAYIMECSPRAGGNRLSEMIKYATGVDMIKASVQAALGEKVANIEQRPYEGYWAEIILHSDKVGKFRGLEIANSIQNNLVEVDLWIKRGEKVGNFQSANEAIGTLVLKFDCSERLNWVLDNILRYVKVLVE